MALPIPSDFGCNYNGFAFDPATSLTTGLKVRVVEDATGRTAAYNEISLQIRCEIIGQPTDPTVLRARQRLTKYGGVLVYGGRGIGPLNINTGRVKDIRFGPKPRVLSLKPLGYKNACELDWEVVVHIPECPDARYSLGFLDLSYRMEFHIGRGGRVDRVVSGTLRVPNNRVYPGSENVLDSPDLYREKIAPPVPFWFHREWQPWRVDESRTSLGFGWTDREFGKDCYPPGVVHIDASHTVRNDMKGGVTVTSIGTLRAKITLAADADPDLGRRAFLHIYKKRVQDRADAKNPTFRNPDNSVSYFPLTFEFGEPDIFGADTTCECSSTYKIIGANLQTLIRDTGLWEPIYDKPEDWTGWYKSLANSALHPYGLSRVTFAPGSDQIIDLCQANPRGLRMPGQARSIRQKPVGGLEFPPITESGSWWSYLINLFVETDSGTVETRALAQRDLPKPKPSSTPAELRGGQLKPTEIAPPPRPVAADPGGYQSLAGAIADFEARVAAVGGSSRGGGGTGGSAGRGKGNPPPDGGATGKKPPDPREVQRVQRRTPPVTALFLTGEAIRVGFEVPPPSLGDVDGIAPVLATRQDMGEGFVTGIVGTTATGVPIYGAKWNLRYVLPEQPGGPVLPPDPATWMGRNLG